MRALQPYLVLFALGIGLASQALFMRRAVVVYFFVSFLVGLATGISASSLAQGFRRSLAAFLGSCTFFVGLVLLKDTHTENRSEIFQAGFLLIPLIYLPWILSLPLGRGIARLTGRK